MFFADNFLSMFQNLLLVPNRQCKAGIKAQKTCWRDSDCQDCSESCEFDLNSEHEKHGICCPRGQQIFPYILP